MPYTRLFDTRPQTAVSPAPFDRDLRFPDPDWEQARADWMNGAPLSRIVGADPFLLQESVGRDQPNRRPDVFRLQALLHRESHLDATTTGGPTGYWGGRDDTALRAFQKENRLAIDGWAAPDGETIGTLRGLYAEKPLQPAQAGTAAERPDGGWQDPWPDSPIHPAFRSRLFERESRGMPDHGYGAENDGA